MKAVGGMNWKTVPSVYAADYSGLYEGGRSRVKKGIIFWGVNRGKTLSEEPCRGGGWKGAVVRKRE